MLTMIVARVYMLSSYHKDNLMSMLKSHLPPPMEMNIMDPWKRYSGYAFFYAQTGGVAGSIWMGNPIYTVGNDPAEQRYYHHFSATGGLLLKDPRFLFLTRGVHIVERNGGAATTFYDPKLMAKDGEKYFNPRAGRFGDNKKDSLFATPVPIGWHRNAPDHMNILGRDYCYQKMGLVRQQDMVDLHYPSAFRFCCRWNINGANMQPAAVAGFSREQDGKQPNTNLMRGQTDRWDRYKKCFSQEKRIIGNDHWGEGCTYAGCQKARSGAEPFRNTIVAQISN